MKKDKRKILYIPMKKDKRKILYILPSKTYPSPTEFGLN